MSPQGTRSHGASVPRVGRHGNTKGGETETDRINVGSRKRALGVRRVRGWTGLLEGGMEVSFLAARTEVLHGWS